MSFTSLLSQFKSCSIFLILCESCIKTFEYIMPFLILNKLDLSMYADWFICYLEYHPCCFAGTRWAWEQYLWNHSLEYWSTFLLSSWRWSDMSASAYLPIYLPMEALLFSRIYGPPLGSTLHSIWEKFNKKLLPE